MNAEGRFVILSMFFAAFILFLIGACSDNGRWTYHKDGNYGPRWWDDKTHAKYSKEYSQPSDSAPESLKPFYDPGLTQALNR